MITTIYIVIFWLMQAIAQLLFKWGSLSDKYWLTGFLLGNLFGFSSIWLLMLVYKNIQPNVALGLATSGGFVLSQIAIVLIFKSSLAPIQWIGMLTIVIGVVLLSSGSVVRIE